MKVNNNGSHMPDLRKVTRLRAIYRFLRKWTIVSFCMFLIMLGLNIHLMIKNRNISINRTQRGFALMKATVQDLQSTNEKAVKVLKEVNSLIKVTQEEMFRDQLAGLLVDSLAEENAKVNFFDMVKIVESSQKYAAALSSCPFTYKDILAIGWLESDFKIDAVGTHGERGIWQILAWKQYLSQIRRWDAYDVDTNCCMATMELKYKFETKGNYRDAIIAYNGWVIQDGEVRTTYYNAFMTRKRRVESLCRKAEEKTNAIWK